MILTDQGASGSFGCLLNSKTHLWTRILSYFEPYVANLASKFPQTTNKTPKNCLEKFEVSVKNAEFYDEFRYKKWAANNFS